MKTPLSVLLCTVALSLTCGMSQAQEAPYMGSDVPDTRQFYEPLTPYGAWVETDTYGYCWHPNGVAPDWRPYTDGHWVSSDCGWYWDSDEPWGWACYHYGRWTYDPTYAWLWVPDTIWGPAWVSWRSGAGYCGWAPLPPQCHWVGGTFLFNDAWIAPNWYVFVSQRNFCDPVRPTTVIVNPTLVSRTRNVTRFDRRENVVIAHGPDVRTIEHMAARRVPTVTFAQHAAAAGATPVFERRLPSALAARERVEHPGYVAPHAVERSPGEKLPPTPRAAESGGAQPPLYQKHELPPQVHEMYQQRHAQWNTMLHSAPATHPAEPRPAEAPHATPAPRPNERERER